MFPLMLFYQVCGRACTPPKMLTNPVAPKSNAVVFCMQQFHYCGFIILAWFVSDVCVCVWCVRVHVREDEPCFKWRKCNTQVNVRPSISQWWGVTHTDIPLTQTHKHTTWLPGAHPFKSLPQQWACSEHSEPQTSKSLPLSMLRTLWTPNI